MALPTFQLFPNFPNEIQTLIWEMAMPDSRNINFRRVGNRIKIHKYHDIIQGSSISPIIRAIADPPILLHVCKHSREVALQSYKLNYLVGQQIYINFEKDVLDFETLEGLRLVLSGVRKPRHRRNLLENICHLRIGGTICRSDLNGCRIDEMPKLSTVEIDVAPKQPTLDFQGSISHVELQEYLNPDPAKSGRCIGELWAKKYGSDNMPTLFQRPREFDEQFPALCHTVASGSAWF